MPAGISPCVGLMIKIGDGRLQSRVLQNRITRGKVQLSAAPLRFRIWE